MAAPQQQAGAIEVDDGFETDSAVGSIDEQLSAYSQSLTSSVTSYPIENGRRYHAYKDGSYFMPNDEEEQDRLDLFHHMLMISTEGKHFYSPLEKGKVKRILDCGTGTGIWAIEMADRFPDAEVLGNDLSPVQPAWVPPNLKFEIDDLESPWTHASTFDFIFARYLDGSIGNWEALVSNMFHKTSPGGWVELHGFGGHYQSDDSSLKPDAYLNQHRKALEEACAKIGKVLYSGPPLERLMKDAGFVNVQTRLHKIPIGPWPKDKNLKEIGLINLMQFLEGLDAFSLRLCISVLGWKSEEAQVLLAKVRQELKDKSIHAYYNYYIAYGQKPQVGTEQ